MTIKQFSRKNIGKLLGMLLVVLISIIYTIPNFYGEEPAVQISSINATPISTEAKRNILNNLSKAKLSPLASQLHGTILTLLFPSSDRQLQARDFITQKFGNQYHIGLNLAPLTPSWLKALGALPMKLGLDLRGGVHLLLDVDIETVLKAKQIGDSQSMKQTLRAKDIHYISINQTQTSQTTFSFTDRNSAKKASIELEKQFPEYHFSLKKNGKAYHLAAAPIDASINRLKNYLIDQTINTINNRVNELGVSEAVVQRQGSDHISVDLPGIQDSARAKEILGKTATLRFHLQDVTHDPFKAQEQGAPLGSRLYFYEGRPVLLKNIAILKGDSITFATATMRNGRAAVNIHLGGGGESRFNEVTAQNIGHPLAVVYVESKRRIEMIQGKPVLTRYQQEKVINIATIQSPLGNSFDITGIGSQKQAEDLALLLRSGSLAAPVDIVQETTVGPSLGQANIDKGILSLEFGSLLVILFMALYYRTFGLVANFALILNILMIIAALSLIGMTLTLPGIAGIVLTVGMAVDANVLINERIREELRLGMSPLASIAAGYDRAFATIVDANVTTLIVALILFGLGSGSVKGFAITLTIGLLCSMLTSITFTRIVIDFIYNPQRSFKKLSIGI